MNVRRLACFLLGAWFAGSIVVFLMADHNSRTAAQLMLRLSPAAAEQAHRVPPAQLRGLVNYTAAEASRGSFALWNGVQVVYSAAFFAFLLFLTREGKLALGSALAMFVIVLLQTFMLTPEIGALGRLTDFMPADSPERSKLWVMEKSYWFLEALKWVVGLGLAGKYVFTYSSRSDAGDKLDLVNKRNYGHINR